MPDSPSSTTGQVNWIFPSGKLVGEGRLAGEGMCGRALSQIFWIDDVWTSLEARTRLSVIAAHRRTVESLE